MNPAKPARVAIFVFPGVQLLDVAGPAEVFSTASRVWERRTGRSAYALELVAVRRGLIQSSGGLALRAERPLGALRRVHTLVLPGSVTLPDEETPPAVVQAIQRLHARGTRLASVCTGAWLLAKAGLLSGRRATTHWLFAERLARDVPRARVEPDAIFVNDRGVWTSAGISAGMDLALALVEADLGRKVALATARLLVLFLKRPGGQSQFSTFLRGQMTDRQALSRVTEHVARHPEEDLGVEALTSLAHMSPRNFARVFTRELGVSPGRFVRTVRVEAARRRLEDSEDGVEAVARAVGLSYEAMRAAFQQQLGVTPADYRTRFH